MSLKHLGGWNYRVLRYKDGGLGIHEVFYTDGKPASCTEDPVGIVGDDLEEMQREAQNMLLAMAAEILDYESFVAGSQRQGDEPMGRTSSE